MDEDAIPRCYIRISMNNLKDIHNYANFRDTNHPVVILGFQWTIWRTYTTLPEYEKKRYGCYIRISMNNLKDIHNIMANMHVFQEVVILGFQWTIWLQKYRKNKKYANLYEIYLHISQKTTTFAATNLKDIHNKDYSVV